MHDACLTAPVGSSPKGKSLARQFLDIIERNGHDSEIEKRIKALESVVRRYPSKVHDINNMLTMLKSVKYMEKNSVKCLITKVDNFIIACGKKSMLSRRSV